MPPLPPLPPLPKETLERTLVLPDASLPYLLTYKPRLRRLWVRVGPGAIIRVSAPKRCGEADIEDFLRSKSPWIRRHLERRERVREGRPPLAHGSTVPLLGRTLTLDVAAGARPRATEDGSLLRVSLPPETRLSAVLERWYRRRAAELLAARTRGWSEAAGIDVGRISIRGQRTLWGSCSRRNDLSLNWRLLLAPPEVADYVILHELAHVKVKNHSARFWSHLADLCPDFKARLKWLKENGPALTLED